MGPEQEHGKASAETEESHWQELRAQAEQVAEGIRGKATRDWSLENFQSTIHELLVYQIELQMQNLELRQAQTALEAARERYFELFDFAPVGYLILNEKGLITEANHTAAALLELPVRKLLQRGLGKLILKEDQESYFLHRQQLLKTGLNQKFELRLLRKGEGFIWVLMEETLLRPEQGPGCSRVTLSDITELKQGAEDRDRLRARLWEAEKMDSLGALSGGVAKEMNKVLSAIQALASGHGQGGGADLEAIRAACLRGKTLVLGLFGFAKPALAHAQTVDLNSLVRNETALLARLPAEHGLTLELDLQEELPAIKGDPAALGCALMNLTQNAREAMPEGGSLTLRTRTEGTATVVLEVADSGPGIPGELLGKALEPFASSKEGKLGLGLSIAYGAVKAHGGTLELASVPGKGTTARLSFPASSAARKP